MAKLNTNQRLREFFYYPKLSEEEDGPTHLASVRRHLEQDTDARISAGADGDREFDTFIYIHIPFCDYLCHFCGFYKTLNQTTPADVKQAFVDQLVREIHIYARLPQLEGRRIRWVEFGGGTPTSLSTQQLTHILRELRSAFDLTDCEFITMEGDALTLQDGQKMRTLVSEGLNRVSYGVQTFKEPLRRKLGLKPTIDDVFAAASGIRDAGVSEFAVDLLYNLPDQSVDDLARDVHEILRLHADYVDAYPLTLWDNSRFKGQVESGRMYDKAPNDEDNVAMFRIIQREMAAATYKPIHSYTFTRGHRPYVENVKVNILNDGDMIGLGPSARGHVGAVQYSNHASLDRYIGDLADGRLPLSLGMHVDEAERAHRVMVMFPSLLLSIRDVDVPDVSGFRSTLADLVDQGFVERRSETWDMTNEGLVWAGNISRLFFSPAQKAKMTRAHLFALRHKVNPYNQDLVGVTGAKARDRKLSPRARG